MTKETSHSDPCKTIGPTKGKLPMLFTLFLYSPPSTIYKELLLTPAAVWLTCIFVNCHFCKSLVFDWLPCLWFFVNVNLERGFASPFIVMLPYFSLKMKLILCEALIDILILKTMLLPRIFFQRLSGMAQAKSRFHFLPFVFLWEGCPTWYTTPTCSHPSMYVDTHTHAVSHSTTKGVRCDDCLSTLPSSAAHLPSPPSVSLLRQGMHACVCYLQMAEEL